MKRNLPILLAAAVFLAMVAWMRAAAPLFARLFPDSMPPVYDRGDFLSLAVSHLTLVFGALCVAGAIGIGGAALATRPWGVAFAPIVGAIATIGQSFPPAAVLAVLVPVLGFGEAPIFVALSLYGLLPITRHALAGFAAVPVAVRDAAKGLGLTENQILRQVDLPLAMPQILAGLRTAATVGLGTATIGSTVGALTLGTPIIDGLVSNKPNFVLQGAVPLAVLAVLFELVFERLDASTHRWTSPRR